MSTTRPQLPGFLRWSGTQESARPTTQFKKEKLIEYAGFWRRTAAVILDCMLLFTLTAPVLYLIYSHSYFYWLLTSTDLFAVYGAWDLILTRILPVLSIVIFWQRCGATPGKMLMSCRIVNSEDRQAIDTAKSVTRLACYFASSLPLNLGFFWVGWDKKKQGFHDKMAKTLVLYTPHDYAEQSLKELMNEIR